MMSPPSKISRGTQEEFDAFIRGVEVFGRFQQAEEEIYNSIKEELFSYLCVVALLYTDFSLAKGLVLIGVVRSLSILNRWHLKNKLRDKMTKEVAEAFRIEDDEDGPE